MLRSFAHRLAAQPRVYDAIQYLFGYPRMRRFLAPRLGQLRQASVLDVGAGTGQAAALLDPSVAYYWLDSDPLKFAGFRAKGGVGRAVIGDAARLGLRSGAVDYTLCMSVAHHLPDELLPALLAELRRVSRCGLFFWEPVWQPASAASRLLWAYDRGSFPRPADRLVEALQAHFVLDEVQHFHIYHHYLYCRARSA